MHAYDLFFYFFKLHYFFFIIIIIAWFFENGRFSHDLKEHSAQDGYEEGKKKRDRKVLGKAVFGKLTKASFGK